MATNPSAVAYRRGSRWISLSIVSNSAAASGHDHSSDRRRGRADATKCSREIARRASSSDASASGYLPLASWLLIFKWRQGSLHPSTGDLVVDQSQALVVAAGSKQLLRFFPVRGDRPGSAGEPAREKPRARSRQVPTPVDTEASVREPFPV